MKHRRIVALLAAMLVIAALAGLPSPHVRAAPEATSTDIAGPAGSGQFGYQVVALPNGNIVITDPYYDAGAIADVGAVYLYDGATGTLISTLTGGTANDWVGFMPIAVLPNGNFVVRSPNWDNGSAAEAGAVTWCSATTGCSGAVSAANSLVGGTSTDLVGSTSIVVLSNGNYVVPSVAWNSGGTTDIGAVTWCDGTIACTGAVSAANSLVGSTTGDSVGAYVTALSNGNYVVGAPEWHNGAVARAGAATWCNGAGGCNGQTVSTSNSLVGSAVNDMIGNYVTALTNGHYVVYSLNWDNGVSSNVGAASWCDGTTGRVGAVTTANSLVGSVANAQVGTAVIALSNGNYVVSSYRWPNGGTAGVGAATWCNATGGCNGQSVSAANSLIGSTTQDWVGYSVVALSNGNYVVSSRSWNNGAITDAGAVTWCSGTAGCIGAVSTGNSLVGSTANDQVGYGVTALSNGNYVVRSEYWDNAGAADAGAATWCNGTTGCTGAVSAGNSLVGSTANNRVGFGVTPLSNSNYVVQSPLWDNGGTSDAGAATWCSGTAGCTGAVTTGNSLTGSTASDQVGYGAMPLASGSYVITAPFWDNGGTTDVGAATWCSATAGCAGAVSTANSLVGSTAGDQIGAFYSAPLANGNYIIRSPNWDNAATTDAGAVTLGAGNGGTASTIAASNSVRGAASGGGSGMANACAFDTTNDQLVVGRPYENLVSLFRPTYTAIASANWSLGTTWDYGTPSARADAVIPSPHAVTLDAGQAIRSLTINSGGALTVSGSNGLALSGDWNRGGTFNPGSGTVTFNGAAAQAIAGATTFYNLTINNTAATPSDSVDVDPDAAVTVQNLLVVQDGQFQPAAGSSFKDIEIRANGILKPDAGAGISVSGNWANNGGVFTANSGAVTFNGTANQTISGNSSFNLITINNTGASGNNIVEVSSSAFSAPAGFLTLTSGIFKMSGSFSFSNSFFSPAAYTIPAAAGLWLNNPNVTVTAQNGTPTLSGLLRITSGTYNVGASSGNSLQYGNGATFTMEGGALNIAGRFSGTGTAQTIAFDMNGGTMTVAAVGHTAARASFDIPATGSSFTMSGGTIVLQTQSTAGTPLDYRNVAGTASITGGTVQFGNASTSGSPSFEAGVSGGLASVFPNLTINATGTPSVNLNSGIVVNGNLAIGSGTNLTANAQNISLTGNWINNGGTFAPGTGTVTFNGSAAQTIGGSSSTAFNYLTINNANGVSLATNERVDGVLTLNNGWLSLDTHDLTLGPNATTAGSPSASAMVVTDANGSGSGGALCKVYPDGTSDPAAILFPVGDTFVNAEYSPVTLDFGSTAFSSSKVCVQAINNDLTYGGAGGTNRLERYWNVTPTNLPGTVSCLSKFQYVSADEQGSNATMVGVKWDSANSKWVYVGGLQAGPPPYFQGTVTSFSQFTAIDYNPTAITLASMAAATQGDAVEVTWDTVSEANNAGFNLYRDTSPAGPGIKINTDLIPSQAPGSQEGYHYSYLDNGWLTPDTTYYYWLEDVSTTGVATRHEPVSVLYTGSPTAVSLAGLSAATSSALPAALPFAAAGLALVALAGLGLKRRR